MSKCTYKYMKFVGEEINKKIYIPTKIHENFGVAEIVFLWEFKGNCARSKWDPLRSFDTKITTPYFPPEYDNCAQKFWTFWKSPPPPTENAIFAQSKNTYLQKKTVFDRGPTGCGTGQHRAITLLRFNISSICQFWTFLAA